MPLSVLDQNYRVLSLLPLSLRSSFTKGIIFEYGLEDFVKMHVDFAPSFFLSFSFFFFKLFVCVRGIVSKISSVLQSNLQQLCPYSRLRVGRASGFDFTYYLFFATKESSFSLTKESCCPV